ncbi:MAG: DUF885 family protein [Gemmatimonadota bacterium]|nr:DUF885 family protein [Gemmatimonadota bacterium]
MRPRDFAAALLFVGAAWHAAGAQASASRPRPAAGAAKHVQEQPALLAPDAKLLLAERGSEMRGVVERYTADRGVLNRRYPQQYSAPQRAVLGKFYAAWLAQLQGVDFGKLSHDAKADHVLLRNTIEQAQDELSRDAKVYADLAPLLPFGDSIFALEDARRRMETVDGQRSARTLAYIGTTVNALRTKLENPPKGDSSAAKITKVAAYRAAEVTASMRTLLRSWHQFYNGYDPLFSWWTGAPYRSADSALTNYQRVLREKIVGWKRGEDEPIVGLPIGRAAIEGSIRHEMLPYSPEELIAIAQKELDWGESEMKKASREMGFGDDWKAAMEQVKQRYVPPGDQVNLVRDLEFEAVAWLRAHDMITIPPLAQDVWRIEMISPERQKVSPFFLGGEVLQVAYPTDSMSDEDKLMAMRGNNPHFSHATVFHEMIPGHHMQGFMNARYYPYRREFGTPFWSEGSAFYWETILWDNGFHSKPEDRIGALFWRMHRAARIIFSLNFHLGNWTPQQCIDFLVARVGHERANATAEVRRSFNGSYGPLYQVAYMMGGLQFRALHHEVVDGGKLTNRQFHDFIYTHGTMPVEMVRVLILRQPLTKDYATQWKFAATLPPPGGK